MRLDLASQINGQNQSFSSFRKRRFGHTFLIVQTFENTAFYCERPKRKVFENLNVRVRAWHARNKSENGKKAWELKVRFRPKTMHKG